MANQCTKFEVSRFSHSEHMLEGGQKILMGHMIITTPL